MGKMVGSSKTASLSGIGGLTLAIVLAASCSSTSGGPWVKWDVGSSCTPTLESEPSFLGFKVGELAIESNAGECLTGVCLVNHFQGRVSCPYGQQADGTPAAGAGACTTTNGQSYGCCTPGARQGVTGLDANGNPVDPVAQDAVKPQCLDRSPQKAVYCSCRCANESGNTNDGATYCTCPTGFACTQLVTAISASNDGVAGGYCVKNGTQYDPNVGACAGICDPVLKNCGPVQNP
jgi:hypothetical protein